MAETGRVEESRRRPGPPAPSRRPVWALVVAAALMAVLAWPLLRGPQRPGQLLDDIPPELLGRWTTTAARYEGRFMVLRPGTLHLGAGEAGILEYTVEEVWAWSEADRRAYQLIYTDADEEQVLELYLYGDGGLRLRNPPDILWTRTPPSGATGP